MQPQIWIKMTLANPRCKQMNICKRSSLFKASYLQINQETSVRLPQDHRESRQRERERGKRAPERREWEPVKQSEQGEMTKTGGWERGIGENECGEINADRERKGSSCQALSGVKHHHKYNLIRSESVHTHIHTQTWPVFKISVFAVSNSKQ